MTVISTLITKHFTVHASDSMISRPGSNGTRAVLEWEQTKIVRVPHFRGAMSYWGLATRDPFGWSTLKWLQAKAQSARHFPSAEAFAVDLAASLHREITSMRITPPTEAGIGIHLTAHEFVDDYWIPELFQISNWTDPSYRTLRPVGVGVTRETYHWTPNWNSAGVWVPEPEHR